MVLKFITNETALTFNKNLVIADLHIGIEKELYDAGIKVPTQTDKIKDRIDHLIKKTKAKRLIIIGDIKHQVPGVSLQELREIPDFFKNFSEKIETHICLGNHDSEIPALVENSALSFPEKKGLRSQRKGFSSGVQIHGTDGFRLSDAYIMHGHSWPKKEFLGCKYLIISHTHPLIEIRDKLGYRFSERVWVRALFQKKEIFKKYGIAGKRLPEIILMPAFNDLSGGVSLNIETGKRKKLTEQTFLGPITKLIDKKQTEIFLLDGTFLGKLVDLKKGVNV